MDCRAAALTNQNLEIQQLRKKKKNTTGKQKLTNYFSTSQQDNREEELLGTASPSSGWCLGNSVSIIIMTISQPRRANGS